MQLGSLYAYTGGKPLDGTRPAVVFLHGAQHDHSVWILQSRWFAHHQYNVLAFDLPGHGRSGGTALSTVPEMAAALAAALAPLACPGFVLVGHSLGSLIALELARRLGAQAMGVALVGTAFPMRVANALLSACRDAPDEAMQTINVWSHRAGLAPFAARPGNPGPGFSIVWENLRLMQRIARANGPTVLPTDFNACNAYDGGLAAAQALPCPALFVLGQNDQMTPPQAACGLIDACHDKQVVMLPATGHASMAENPEGVRRALADFAARVLV